MLQTARLVSVAVRGLLADALSVEAVYLLGGSLLLAAGLLGLAITPAAQMRSTATPT